MLGAPFLCYARTETERGRSPSMVQPADGLARTTRRVSASPRANGEGASLSIRLSAVIVAATPDEPRVLVPRSDPKTRSKGVVDGRQVNIPAPALWTNHVTLRGRGAPG
jgi:hypothetical protein